MTKPESLSPVAAGSLPHPRFTGGPLRKRLTVLAVIMTAGAALFFLYLQQAQRVQFGSDGAVVAQAGWDMLHGNLLLRGWSLTDIPFYTIEIPGFAALEWIRGSLSPEIVRIGEALALTLVVVLAAVVAKGEATGRTGLIRALIAGGIMLAPTPGVTGTLMLANPDHLATQIPLLLVWLILDRAVPSWWVPTAVAALLAWARVSDPIVLLEAEIPLLIVCVIRMYRRRGPLRGHWYELSLAAAVVVADRAAAVAARLIRDRGGFTAFPLKETFASVDGLSSHVWVTARSVLDLYGADFSGQPLKASPGLLIPAVHLAGVALAVAAAWYAVRRFFASDLMVQVLTVSLVTVLLAYTLLGTPTSGGGAHNLMPVLPAGAILAGRLLTGGLIRRGLIPALAVALALYAGILVRDAVQPLPANPRLALAAWLQDHHLDYGLASYYTANLVTVDSGNSVMVAPVSRRGGRLVLSPWNSQASWYDPARHDATFFIVNPMQGCPPGDTGIWLAAARNAFGPQAATYSAYGVRILVWHRNLLRGHLARVPAARPSAC
jgi:hypothetical protein